MELSLTGDLLAQILSVSKKDTKLPTTLARKYLEVVDPLAIARYLLTKDVAVDLLAQKLRKDPAGTIRALQRMPSTGGARPRRPSAKRAAPARAGKRRRLNTAQSEALKKQVVAFLAKHPWATRKQLTAAVPLKTQAVYRRIMHELQDAGKIVGKGQKSKAVYALAGARKGARRKRTRRA
jgi:hypothetical protein